jgi:aspartyl-tRNA(Asn)/glutamyl-tRNA(Gln) amidotransferase subunit A
MDESRPSFPAEPTFFIGEKKGPIAMFPFFIFRVKANLAGIPVVSIPVGLSKQRFSVGFKIIGLFFQESQLFKLAFLLEKKVKFRTSKLILHRKEE